MAGDVTTKDYGTLPGVGIYCGECGGRVEWMGSNYAGTAAGLAELRRHSLSGRDVCDETLGAFNDGVAFCRCVTEASRP